MNTTPNQSEGITIGTAADMAQQIVKAEVWKFYAPEEAQQVWDRISRYFEPWPDWVFRVAAEVYHVGFPTFPKDKIEGAFRAVHSFVFFTKLENVDYFGFLSEPEAINKALGGFAGHGMAHLERESKAVADMSPSDEKLTQIEAYNFYRVRMTNFISEQLKVWPEDSCVFLKALIMAEPKTFDVNGGLKESPLTPIYRKILYNWRHVESLSGPTALRDYLSPMLGNQHDEDKLERVKKISQRVGITFKKPVKGQ